MYKKIYYGEEARRIIAQGANKVADAVKVTLGAMGKNVVIGRDGINPHITKDGVTVAKSIFLKDYAESIGANLIKEVAMKVVEKAGDGTTTATILCQELINQSLTAIHDGSNAIHVKQGLEAGLEFCIQELQKMSVEVTNDDLINIATIAANNDHVLGKLISDAFIEVGKHGIINVELSKSGESCLNLSKGFRFDQGFVSAYFATKGKCVLTNPYILLVDGRINNISEIQSLLDICVKTKKHLLIICEGVDENTLEALTYNHQNKNLISCVVKSEGYGEDRIVGLEDLRHTVGGVIYGKNHPLSQINLNQLGNAEQVIITSSTTEIIGGRLGDKYKNELIQDIVTKLDTMIDGWDKDQLKKRLSNLQALVATIRIGGYTDTELKEKYDRVDDAVQACRAALAEGYVMGGGTTLLFLSQKLQMHYEGLHVNPGQNHGYIVLLESMYAPFIQLLNNAGVDDCTNSIQDILSKGYGTGIDVRTMHIEDFKIKGIIDPTKVIRVCLESAVSIASILLTTECVISEDDNYATNSIN